MNANTHPLFSLRLAETCEDIRLAQSLRYQVFVNELGASGGADVDHDAGLEIDAFDASCDHMLLFDESAQRLAGVYRLLRSDQVRDGFYSAGEYDLSPLTSSSRKLLELGRSCLHPAYRGGSAMYHLWNGLAAYVEDHGIDLLFGVASFHGTDLDALAAPLSLLHQKYLAPAELRPKVLPPHGRAIDLRADGTFDRREAMVQIPALIKAYLRLGGVVGEGAWVDRDFNTTDVCLVLDTQAMSARQRQIYTKTG